ncbi:MAG: hypothetical protein KAJ05_01160, partial [Candidatus Latescibacteria bacterium]|nr:hypothetical protein [Candidatus Latescibacterota bacterium]
EERIIFFKYTTLKVKRQGVFEEGGRNGGLLEKMVCEIFPDKSGITQNLFRHKKAAQSTKLRTVFLHIFDDSAVSPPFSDLSGTVRGPLAEAGLPGHSTASAHPPQDAPTRCG